MQVTPAGQPTLLLGDRGRISGYQKPTVIHPQDLPLAAQSTCSFSALRVWPG
ncbi:hypothetical protein [Deinococcus sp. QL22]|uniref:hypothetical protein n=1 Tax=Deinococcus sp. QL22 TaxID=2939437 RepID=UPI002017E0E2|nr:hypothetical protein [Deinococcus sp. QL22]UQN09021.1 hypothetical protein M1R55_20815 [Deinococcus sp. QL22]